ncbi:hypothetical protein [Rhodoferax sp.]|uniref:hypothetical protein n=1 Tax=Rhodoferax sp. TaxID=50421 RepID=UPI0026051BAE|nr:hypothetical protein [Rhodoferax sp.]
MFAVTACAPSELTASKEAARIFEMLNMVTSRNGCVMLLDVSALSNGFIGKPMQLLCYHQIDQPFGVAVAECFKASVQPTATAM